MLEVLESSIAWAVLITTILGAYVVPVFLCLTLIVWGVWLWEKLLSARLQALGLLNAMSLYCGLCFRVEPKDNHKWIAAQVNERMRRIYEESPDLAVMCVERLYEEFCAEDKE